LHEVYIMKLTSDVLKKIIAEEVAKFKESKLFGDMESTEDAAEAGGRKRS